MFGRPLAALTIMLVALFGATSSHAATAFVTAVATGGTVDGIYSVDTGSGATALVWSDPAFFLNAIAADPTTGHLYFDSGGNLYKLDPNAAAPAPQLVGAVSVRDLAFKSDGSLYGSQGGFGNQAGYSVFSISVLDGSLGATIGGNGGGGGIAAIGNDTMVWWANANAGCRFCGGDGVLDGEASFFLDLASGPGVVRMAYDRETDSILIPFVNDLSRESLADGSSNPLGFSLPFSRIYGVTVPEPGAIALLAVAGLAWARAAARAISARGR